MCPENLRFLIITIVQFMFLVKVNNVSFLTFSVNVFSFLSKQASYFQPNNLTWRVFCLIYRRVSRIQEGVVVPPLFYYPIEFLDVETNERRGWVAASKYTCRYIGNKLSLGCSMPCKTAKVELRKG